MVDDRLDLQITCFGQNRELMIQPVSDFNIWFKSRVGEFSCLDCDHLVSTDYPICFMG